MDLIVFDLDGTLLNRHSALSDGTRDTLKRLADRGIAYTVATGRTLHARYWRAATSICLTSIRTV